MSRANGDGGDSMWIRRIWLAAMFALAACVALQAADKLKLNPRLDYSSDSQDGPLITGSQMDEGLASDRPNYVIFFGEG